MTKSKHETMENILKSAKKEFLLNGYEKASMRTIAENAGVTTGALYTRFPNKDALFGILVAEVAAEWKKFYIAGNEKGQRYLAEGHPEEMWSVTDETIEFAVDFIYKNRDVFSLLINHSTGSSYEDFMEEIINYEEEQTYIYLQKLYEKGYPVKQASKEDIHVITSAQFYAIFEIVRHETPEKDAYNRIYFIGDFFKNGWKSILGI